MTLPRDLFADIAEINAWFEAHNGPSPHEDAMRVMKPGEEIAEAYEALALCSLAQGRVVEAYIGMTGQNPRKGVTHSLDDLLLELADVAISALCAIQHFAQDVQGTRNLVLRKSALGTQRVAAHPAPEMST
jgi:hypothetical protein